MLKLTKERLSAPCVAAIVFDARLTLTKRVVCRSKELHKRMVYLRGHAMSPDRRFWHTEVGYNYRLSNLLCAVGVAQLERFDELFGGRKRVIDAYRSSFEGFKGVKINPHW